MLTSSCGSSCRIPVFDRGCRLGSLAVHHICECGSTAGPVLDPLSCGCCLAGRVRWSCLAVRGICSILVRKACNLHPVPPGGLGTTDAIITALLTTFGLPTNDALAGPNDDELSRSCVSGNSRCFRHQPDDPGSNAEAIAGGEPVARTRRTGSVSPWSLLVSDSTLRLSAGVRFLGIRSHSGLNPIAGVVSIAMRNDAKGLMSSR